MKGFNCDGALWYHDTTRNIHKELIDGKFASFRIFTGAYIHPSDKYIFIPDWEPTAYLISKDYGQTWRVATYMASFPALERNSDGVMRDYPEGKEIKRVVVVMKKGLNNLVESEKSNYQNLPDKEPEVVGYKGWTRMRCDLDAGK